MTLLTDEDLICNVGVHAWKTLDGAKEYAGGIMEVVIGRVELWGEVVEHERGYRAEFAAIKSLDFFKNTYRSTFFNSDRRRLNKLRKLYGVKKD